MPVMTILAFTILLLVIIFLLVTIVKVGDRQARLSASLLYEIKELNHLLRAKEGFLKVNQPMPSRPKA